MANGQSPQPSPQVGWRKRPPATKNRSTAAAGRRWRHAGARPEGAVGGHNSHGHFGHLSSRKRADGIQSDLATRVGRNRGPVDEEAVLQRRRRWDHDDDACGCRGRSIHISSRLAAVEGGGRWRRVRRGASGTAACPFLTEIWIFLIKKNLEFLRQLEWKYYKIIQSPHK